MPRVSIVIPCYNEVDTIAEVVARVKAVDLGAVEREIIVVDDGSTDGTRSVLPSLGDARVILHERNRGKGAAVGTGFAAASGDVLVIQDADLEYDPADIKAVVAPILEDRADVVLGSRFSLSRPSFFVGEKRDPFFSHYVGNIAIIWLTNTLYGYRATDYEGAYKAFRKSTLQGLKVRAQGFEYDNELVCKALRRRCRLVEVPIRYRPRPYSAGKKITWRDGLVMLWTIVKWRFLPLD